MIPFETASMFFAASIALALAPGPDNIFVLTQSALYGRKAGLLVTLGLCTGLLVHTLAVSLGVAAILQTSMVAFTTVKVLGAAYLLFLAVQAFRAKATDVGVERRPTRSTRGLYARGVVMNVTNPKVAIFFLAFLPQFVDPAGGRLTLQLVTLSGIFMSATMIVFGSVAWTAGFLGERIKRSTRVQVVMDRVAGIVFVGLALRLVTSER